MFSGIVLLKLRSWDAVQLVESEKNQVPCRVAEPPVFGGSGSGLLNFGGSGSDTIGYKMKKKKFSEHFF